jgi:hypothetical protein
MPQILAALPFISAILGVGGQVISSMEQEKGQEAAIAAQQQLAQQQQQAQQAATVSQQQAQQRSAKAAVAQEAPSIESITGGGASPDYIQLMAQVLTGNAGGTNFPSFSLSTPSTGGGLGSAPAQGTNMFPNEAVPAYAGLTGGST